MALTFDAANKRIILDRSTITASEIYSRWADWVATSDNSKHLQAFNAIGGDDLGSGLSIPPYYFLTNGWRVRPQENNHTLTITGNLFVQGGGDPVVPTVGTFNVLTKLVVPVQAQGIATSGGGSAAMTPDQAQMLLELYQLEGLKSGSPLNVNNDLNLRQAGDILQSVVTVGNTTTVTRL